MARENGKNKERERERRGRARGIKQRQINEEQKERNRARYVSETERTYRRIDRQMQRAKKEWISAIEREKQKEEEMREIILKIEVRVREKWSK
jgi:hypothetical protein